MNIWVLLIHIIIFLYIIYLFVYFLLLTGRRRMTCLWTWRRWFTPRTRGLWRAGPVSCSWASVRYRPGCSTPAWTSCSRTARVPAPWSARLGTTPCPLCPPSGSFSLSSTANLSPSLQIPDTAMTSVCRVWLAAESRGQSFYFVISLYCIFYENNFLLCYCFNG